MSISSWLRATYPPTVLSSHPVLLSSLRRWSNEPRHTDSGPTICPEVSLCVWKDSWNSKINFLFQLQFLFFFFFKDFPVGPQHIIWVVTGFTTWYVDSSLDHNSLPYLPCSRWLFSLALSRQDCGNPSLIAHAIRRPDHVTRTSVEVYTLAAASERIKNKMATLTYCCLYGTVADH